ncbi:MAG: hypothetical protein RR621_04380, partial [Lachnospiraceae bacterium]
RGCRLIPIFSPLQKIRRFHEIQCFKHLFFRGGLLSFSYTFYFGPQNPYISIFRNTPLSKLLFGRFFLRIFESHHEENGDTYLYFDLLHTA